MFDTNIFNEILKGKWDLSSLGNSKESFWATHVQEGEINNTPDPVKKEQLLKIFKMVSNQTSTSSAVWGRSLWGRSEFPKDRGELFNQIKADLDRKNKNKKNNTEDALIADTSIKKNFSLVTHDSDLFYVVTKLKGKALNFFQLIDEVG